MQIIFILTMNTKSNVNKANQLRKKEHKNAIYTKVVIDFQPSKYGTHFISYVI